MFDDFGILWFRNGPGQNFEVFHRGRSLDVNQDVLDGLHGPIDKLVLVMNLILMNNVVKNMFEFFLDMVEFGSLMMPLMMTYDQVVKAGSRVSIVGLTEVQRQLSSFGFVE